MALRSLQIALSLPVVSGTVTSYGWCPGNGGATSLLSVKIERPMGSAEHRNKDRSEEDHRVKYAKDLGCHSQGSEGGYHDKDHYDYHIDDFDHFRHDRNNEAWKSGQHHGNNFDIDHDHDDREHKDHHGGDHNGHRTHSDSKLYRERSLLALSDEYGHEDHDHDHPHDQSDHGDHHGPANHHHEHKPESHHQEGSDKNHDEGKRSEHHHHDKGDDKGKTSQDDRLRDQREKGKYGSGESGHNDKHSAEKYHSDDHRMEHHSGHTNHNDDHKEDKFSNHGKYGKYEGKYAEQMGYGGIDYQHKNSDKGNTKEKSVIPKCFNSKGAEFTCWLGDCCGDVCMAKGNYCCSGKYPVAKEKDCLKKEKEDKQEKHGHKSYGGH